MMLNVRRIFCILSIILKGTTVLAWESADTCQMAYMELMYNFGWYFSFSKWDFSTDKTGLYDTFSKILTDKNWGPGTSAEGFGTTELILDLTADDPDTPQQGNIFGTNFYFTNVYFIGTTYFRAPMSGTYTFTIEEASDSAMFQVGRDNSYQCCENINKDSDQDPDIPSISELYETALLIESDPQHSTPTFSADLKEGQDYTMVLIFINTSGDAKLKVSVTFPDGTYHTDLNGIIGLPNVLDCNNFHTTTRDYSDWENDYSTTYSTSIITRDMVTTTTLETVYYVLTPSAAPTPEPSSSEEPVITDEPSITEESSSSEEPLPTEESSTLEDSSTSEEPLPTEEPSSEEPIITNGPSSSEEPQITEYPSSSEEPQITEYPPSSEEPVITDGLSSSEEPQVTEYPSSSEEPAITEYTSSSEDAISSDELNETETVTEVPEGSSTVEVLPSSEPETEITSGSTAVSETSSSTIDIDDVTTADGTSSITNYPGVTSSAPSGETTVSDGPVDTGTDTTHDTFTTTDANGNGGTQPTDDVIPTTVPDSDGSGAGNGNSSGDNNADGNNSSDNNSGYNPGGHNSGDNTGSGSEQPSQDGAPDNDGNPESTVTIDALPTNGGQNSGATITGGSESSTGNNNAGNSADNEETGNLGNTSGNSGNNADSAGDNGNMSGSTSNGAISDGDSSEGTVEDDANANVDSNGSMAVSQYPAASGNTVGAADIANEMDATASYTAVHVTTSLAPVASLYSPDAENNAAKFDIGLVANLATLFMFALMI